AHSSASRVRRRDGRLRRRRRRDSDALRRVLRPRLRIWRRQYPGHESGDGGAGARGAVHGLRRPDILQSLVREAAWTARAGVRGRPGVVISASDTEPEQALPTVIRALRLLAATGRSVRMKAWQGDDLRLNGWEPMEGPTWQNRRRRKPGRPSLTKAVVTAQRPVRRSPRRARRSRRTSTSSLMRSTTSSRKTPKSS